MKRRPEQVDHLPPELARFEAARWVPADGDMAYGCTFAEAVADCTPMQTAMWAEAFAWDRWCEARQAWDLEHGVDAGEATLRWLLEKTRGDRAITDRYHAMWAGS